MRYKNIFALLLALALLCGSLSGCAAGQPARSAEPTVSFTDSLGRTVEIPETLTRVAPSGAVASMFSRKRSSATYISPSPARISGVQV